MAAENDKTAPRDSHGKCLLCGDKNPWSLRLDFKRGADGVTRTELKGNKHLQGYDGILHGGVISALLDAAMTHALFHDGIQAVTGDFHVRFKHPVPCLSLMQIKAWQTEAFPPQYRLRADLAVEGRVMAWAEAKFMRRG